MFAESISIFKLSALELPKYLYVFDMKCISKVIAAHMSVIVSFHTNEKANFNSANSAAKSLQSLSQNYQTITEGNGSCHPIFVTTPFASSCKP